MFEEIKKLLIELSNVDESKITIEANLKNDLDIDSLYAAELICELETNYDIRISYNEMQSLETVRDVVKLVEAKVGK